MHYVILRDDDTNALTPIECLERLYRPFLDSGLPVNLATIPSVSTEAMMADGSPEGFLRPALAGARTRAVRLDRSTGRAGFPGSQEIDSTAKNVLSFSNLEATPERSRKPALPSPEPAVVDHARPRTIPMGENQELVDYLQENRGYHILQHGLHHDYLEFDRDDSNEISKRLERGTDLLMEAGFPPPCTFVAPYDRLSRVSLVEVASRFPVLSTGWYELRRLPYSWWPKYALKKMRSSPHWQVGQTLLLSHPGCLLSFRRSQSTMLESIITYLESHQLTVLVTHWWEYFRDGIADEPFIELLHETGAYLASSPNVRVISFDDLAFGRVPLG